MRAVILAAGRGGRLRGVVGNRPKCLARVGDCTLLERQIRVLRASGVEPITVVAGFRVADVAEVAGPAVQIVLNPKHASTNSLYSLWLARALLNEPFIVLNCDVLFHPQLLWDLITARYEDAALVGARAGGPPYSDEEMKVHMRRGVVVEMDKQLGDAEADGENIGIAKFGAAGAAVLVEEIDRIVGAGGAGEWLPRAFDGFCRRRTLHVVESRGYPWIEIDVPEDYWRACAEVLPAIDATSETRPELRAIHHV